MCYSYVCQISAWQSAAVNQYQPVPAWGDEPGSPVKQLSSGGATNNPTLSQDALRQHGKDWLSKLIYCVSVYSAAGGKHVQ